MNTQKKNVPIVSESPQKNSIRSLPTSFRTIVRRYLIFWAISNANLRFFELKILNLKTWQHIRTAANFSNLGDRLFLPISVPNKIINWHFGKKLTIRSRPRDAFSHWIAPKFTIWNFCLLIVSKKIQWFILEANHFNYLGQETLFLNQWPQNLKKIIAYYNIFFQ